MDPEVSSGDVEREVVDNAIHSSTWVVAYFTGDCIGSVVTDPV